GRAVVALDGQRHAVLVEEPLQDALDGPACLVAHEFRGEHVAAESITHRQRLADLAVAGLPPTLEVDRPELVGRVHLDVLSLLDGPQPRERAATLHLAQALEHPRHRALRRRLAPEFHRQDPRDLVGAPARASIAQLDDRGDDILRLRQRARAGPPRLLDQAEWPVRVIAAEPLVARLPRDTVLTAAARDVGTG